MPPRGHCLNSQQITARVRARRAAREREARAAREREASAAREREARELEARKQAEEAKRQRQAAIEIRHIQLAEYERETANTRRALDGLKREENSLLHSILETRTTMQSHKNEYEIKNKFLQEEIDRLYQLIKITQAKASELDRIITELHKEREGIALELEVDKSFYETIFLIIQKLGLGEEPSATLQMRDLVLARTRKSGLSYDVFLEHCLDELTRDSKTKVRTNGQKHSASSYDSEAIESFAKGHDVLAQVDDGTKSVGSVRHRIGFFEFLAKTHSQDHTIIGKHYTPPK